MRLGRTLRRMKMVVYHHGLRWTKAGFSVMH
jgi:hypothetical protein